MTREADAKTVSLVERVIIESKDYETQEQVFEYFKGTLGKDTFNSAISQLLVSGKIMYNGPSIIYTGTDNPSLKALVDSSVPI